MRAAAPPADRRLEWELEALLEEDEVPLRIRRGTCEEPIVEESREESLLLHRRPRDKVYDSDIFVATSSSVCEPEVVSAAKGIERDRQ
jgi:hypothetical protein